MKCESPNTYLSQAATTPVDGLTAVHIGLNSQMHTHSWKAMLSTPESSLS